MYVLFVLISFREKYIKYKCIEIIVNITNKIIEKSIFYSMPQIYIIIIIIKSLIDISIHIFNY